MLKTNSAAKKVPMQLQYLKRNVFECHGFCLMSSLFANLPYIQGENMKQTLRMRNILCPVFLYTRDFYKEFIHKELG